jgi:hypothetical protein
MFSAAQPFALHRRSSGATLWRSLLRCSMAKYLPKCNAADGGTQYERRHTNRLSKQIEEMEWKLQCRERSAELGAPQRIVKRRRKK